MKVVEIFESLQGEGRWTGSAAVFVRLAGCNLRCKFCDTDFSHGEEMSVEEIVAKVASMLPEVVVITGGEPCLQLNAALVDALHAVGKRVHIETNGTIDIDKPLLDKLDWITVSPKDSPVKIRRADEIKVVDVGQDFAQYETLAHRLTADLLYIQPCDEGDAETNLRNTAACVDFVLRHPHWRLSLQIHKLIDIR